MKLRVRLRADRIILFLILFFSFSLYSDAQFYNGTQMSFGKNRVQYNDFEWTYHQFKRFDTYFYKGGKELSEYAGRTTDAEIDEIEKLL